MANFPTSLDSLSDPVANTPRLGSEVARETLQNDAIEAIEGKVGTGSSTPTSGTVLTGTGTGTSAWQAPSAGSGDVATDVIFDAKGDLPVGTAANTAAKLTAGANDTVLMADSAQATGLKWVASQTPSTQAFGDAAAQGSADTYARGDHKHAMPTDPTRWFNVATYGAPGDASDQTTAIQAAITAAGATIDANHRGGTVWFPAGSYIITATLTIPSFVRLTGPGRPWHTVEITGGDPSGYYGADISAAGALDFDMFRNVDTTNGNTGIEIDHLRLDNRGVTGDKDIMRFTLLWRSSIHDIDFLGSTTTTNKWGVRVVSGEENRINDNRFDQCGIYYSGNALTARHNDIGANGIYGFWLNNSFGHRIHENHIYNMSKNAILLHNQIGCSFIANHIEDCDWHGIYGDNLIQDCVFMGNVVKQNSKASAGARSGIYIDSDTATSPSTNNVLTGNVCIDTQGSPTQQYGIYLGSFSGTQTNGNLVTGNQFHGNTVAGFGQKAGLTNIVRNNSGFVTEASGTGSIASGATSAVITHGLSVTPALKDISVTLGELSTTDPGQIYVTTITSTQFTVNCRTNPGASNLDFAWQVAVL